MRIATSQFYANNLNLMQQLQSGVGTAQEQVASGKRLTQASDDPAAAAKVLSLEESVSQYEQFQKNVGVAENALQQEHTTLNTLTNLYQRIRELALQSDNGALSKESHEAIAKEVRARRDELLELANTRNAQGESIFAGFQVRQTTFTTDGLGNYTYHGDEGQRYVQVAKGRSVATGDNGQYLFVQVPSGNGYFEAEETSTNTGTGEISSAEFSTTQTYTSDTYTISFVTNSDGNLAYNVSGAVQGQLIPIPPLDATQDAIGWTEGDVISFGGLDLVITGAPLAGDTFTVEPTPTQSVFATLDQFIDALEAQPAEAGATEAMRETFQETIQNMDHALQRASDVMSAVGTRLATTDSQKISNDDILITTKQALSTVQDVDYAEAISRLKQQLFALEAAQQSFARIQGLSLFNYIS
jgi:flagellar hook-associated protein 3 FlgL